MNRNFSIEFCAIIDLKVIVTPYLFEACFDKWILNYQNSDLENLEKDCALYTRLKFCLILTTQRRGAAYITCGLYTQQYGIYKYIEVSECRLSILCRSLLSIILEISRVSYCFKLFLKSYFQFFQIIFGIGASTSRHYS